MRQKKLTYEQKLSWLRKNKVVLKKEKIRQSTVSRLYSFYHRNPLDTPRNVAYGLSRRVEHKIEIKGENAKIKAPKKITAKEYVKRRREQIDAQTEKKLEEIIKGNEEALRKLQKDFTEKIDIEDIAKLKSRSDFNRHLTWSGKVQDLRWIPCGITCTEKTYKEAIAYFDNFVDIYIMPQIESLVKTRKKMYKAHIIGIRCHFKTTPMKTTVNREFDNYSKGDTYYADKFHTSVLYRDLNNPQWIVTLKNDLLKEVKKGFHKVFDYENSIVTLEEISINILTRETASEYERLRGVEVE